MMLFRGIRAYPTLLRIGAAAALAYRAEMLIWMLTTTMPLVNLLLWRAVAQGGPIGPARLGPGDLSAYFLLTLLVRLLTGSWVLWQMNQDIRTGVMSQLLLRPLHPILGYSAENLAAIPLRGLLVLPIAVAILFFLAGQHLHSDPARIIAFLLSLPGAWAITFVSMAACAALSFYIESSNGLFQLWMGSYVLLSGYSVPLSLLPKALGNVAYLLPFRYMVDFPVSILLKSNTASLSALYGGLALEYLYVVLLIVGTDLLWRAGLRRYEAFGA